jgi:hypothetical protein
MTHPTTRRYLETTLPLNLGLSLLRTSSSVVKYNASLSSKNRGLGNAFVLLSASWSFDFIYTSSIRPCLIWCLVK